MGKFCIDVFIVVVLFFFIVLFLDGSGSAV